MFRAICLLVALALSLPLTAHAAITKVQSTTSATTSIALTGVTAGNTLVLMVGWFRDPSTLAVHPTPTDSSGQTVQVAVSPVPAKYTGASQYDVGSSIFYVTNANAGTHTFTLAAMAARNVTLAEFTPMAVSSFDVSASALTAGPSSATSQATGTTTSTAQANELVMIGATLGVAASGTSDIGWTDPVAGFTTLQKKTNSSSDLPILHAWKEVNATNTQTATFNWSVSNATSFMQAAVATFKTTSSGSGGVPPPVTGATYYLSLTTNSPAGNDANTCTQAQNISTPKATMNSILACAALTAGDTIYIRAGTYNQRMDLITAGKNGTATSPITIMGYPGDATPRWQYHDPIENDYGGIKAWGISGITLKNFILDGSFSTYTAGAVNTNGTGMAIRGGSHDWLLDNMEITGQPDSGLLVMDGANNITVRNSRLHDACGLACYGDVNGHRWYGVYIHDATNVLFEDNDIYNNPGGGFQITDSGGGTTHTINNITVRRNKIHGNGSFNTSNIGGFVLAVGSATTFANITLYDNLVYHNGGLNGTTPGFAPCLYFFGAFSGGVTVYNNTFYDCYVYGIRIESPSATGLILRNNISYGTRSLNVLGDPADSGTGNTLDHNLFTNPLFVNPATFDLHLQAGSAAIDTGASLASLFTYDYALAPRPQGLAWDIGAYEFGSSVSDTIPPTVPTNLSVTANLPNQLLISWTASTDNVGVAGYNVQACSPSVCAPVVNIATTAGTSYTYSGLPDATGYSVQVNAFDASGNRSAFTGVVSTTTQTVAAPTISNANPSGTAVSDASPITINVTTSIPSVCKYNTRTEGTASYAALLHTMTVSGLVASASVTPDIHTSNGGVNHFYIACDNAATAGHTSSTLDMTFTMIAPVDSTAPSTISDFSLVTLDSVRLQATWTAATDAVGVTGYLLSGCAGVDCTAYTITLNVAPGTTSAVLALSTGTIYNFIIQGYDAAGNNALASNVATSQTFSLTAPEDMANLSLSAILQQAVMLQWTTPTVQASTSLFEQCTPMTSSTTCSGTWSQVAVIPLGTLPLITGLAANTSYCWRGKLANDQQQVSANFSNAACATTMSAGQGLKQPRKTAFLQRAPRTP